MRNSNILAIIALITLMLVPTLTHAGIAGPGMDWVWQDYNVSTNVDAVDGAGGGGLSGSDGDSANYVVDLPIGASSNVTPGNQVASASSSISSIGVDSFNMYTGAYSWSEGSESDSFVSTASASASASFDGTFNVPLFAEPLVDEPIFPIIEDMRLTVNYDLFYDMSVESYDDFSYAMHATEVYFVVSGGDLLGDVYVDALASLESQNIEAYGIDGSIETGPLSGSFSIDVTSGFSYNISVNIMEEVEAEFNAEAGAFSTNMNVGMAVAPVAVVPEPISSALFIVGAATLGISGYRRRNRVS